MAKIGVKFWKAYDKDLIGRPNEEKIITSKFHLFFSTESYDFWERGGMVCHIMWYTQQIKMMLKQKVN